jgi:myo-inositol-1(or 4)-monophosphatase
MVKEAFYKDKDLMTKECYADIVTETDQAVEKLIISLLHEKYPTHQ